MLSRARSPHWRAWLLAAGTLLMATGGQAATPMTPDRRALDLDLIAAADAAQPARVAQLLARGAGVQARDARGRTALLAATHANDVGSARLLIAAGADVNARDAIEDSPFLYAGAEGRLDILRLILPAQPDLRSLNRYGGTALIPACHHGHVETVRELLKTAIAVDHVNKLGWTALLETVILGDGSARYQEIARLLLAHGANPRLADHDGVTPLMHARRRGHTALATIIAAAGG